MTKNNLLSYVIYGIIFNSIVIIKIYHLKKKENIIGNILMNGLDKNYVLVRIKINVKSYVDIKIKLMILKILMKKQILKYYKKGVRRKSGKPVKGLKTFSLKKYYVVRRR